MKITVKVYQNGQEIAVKLLGEGVYRLGRSEFSDIPLPDESVSRSHLELRINEAAVYMTNMTTSGKVRVNGKPIETSEIADGDELLVGPYKVIVFHGDRDGVGDAAGGAAGNDAPADGGGLGNPADEVGGEGGFGDNGNGDGGLGENQNGFGENGGGEADGGGGGFGGGLDGGLGEAEGGVAQLEAANDSRVDSPSMNRAETQVEMKSVVAKIVFTEGPRQGEEMFLESYEVTFGRSKRADIFLDDHRLSRVHAKIARVGLGFRLIDLESRNGTFVNGMRVLEHPLNSFDEIALGSTKIKFLIHDMAAGDLAARAALTTVLRTGEIAPADQTRSVAVQAIDPQALLDLQLPSEGFPGMEPLPGGEGPSEFSTPEPMPFYKDRSKRTKLLAGVVVGLLLIFFLLPNGEPGKPGAKTGTDVSTADKISEVKLPPSMPKEWTELSPEMQRAMEGYYNSALRASEQENYEEALAFLKRIHEYLPQYKQSKELLDQYGRKVKEKQILDAQDKAKKDEKQDLAIYLEEGVEYLKTGEFDRAAESFNSAIVIDPSNTIAIQGLKAAEAKVRDMNQIPPDKDPEEDKRKLVAELFQRAVGAFTNKSYQDAIDTADKIRQIELKGDTQYLNEAKQIIDRARMLQKEEFEPFLIQAKEKYAEGDYNASRDLCEEMLKRDAAYDDAKECVFKAKKQLNRLAKEAYTTGYILESMNRIEEAKQYWQRSRNYVRPGDDYFEKVNKKLDYYQ